MWAFVCSLHAPVRAAVFTPAFPPQTLTLQSPPIFQIFSSIHFGNHWALEGISQRKVDLCQSVSADVLIDDNPVYAEECSAAGVRVLLFDWEGSYPWAADKHTRASNGLVTRVFNWEQAEREIMKLVAQHEIAEE